MGDVTDPAASPGLLPDANVVIEYRRTAPNLLPWRRADEPDGLSDNDFGGNRLSRLVRRALDEEVITMGRAAEILGLRRTAMRGWVRGWFG